jgi:hypothetical protein
VRPTYSNLRAQASIFRTALPSAHRRYFASGRSRGHEERCPSDIERGERADRDRAQGRRIAAILRRYLELAPGGRPLFPIDRRAPLGDFERIVEEYPVFRVAPAS